jgi:hypothetical protein
MIIICYSLSQQVDSESKELTVIETAFGAVVFIAVHLLVVFTFV